MTNAVKLTSESALESAIFFMIRTYMDSGLVTPEQADKMLQRLQERAYKYRSQDRANDGEFQPE